MILTTVRAAVLVTLALSLTAALTGCSPATDRSPSSSPAVARPLPPPPAADCDEVPEPAAAPQPSEWAMCSE